jgi:hypothetical protein
MWSFNQNQDTNNQNSNFGWNVNNPVQGGEKQFLSRKSLKSPTIWLLISSTFSSQATITTQEPIWAGISARLPQLLIQQCQCPSRRLHPVTMTVNPVSMKSSNRKMQVL